MWLPFHFNEVHLVSLPFVCHFHLQDLNVAITVHADVLAACSAGPSAVAELTEKLEMFSSIFSPSVISVSLDDVL